MEPLQNPMRVPAVHGSLILLEFALEIVQNGKVVDLKVTPKSRRKDVVYYLSLEQ